MEGVLAYMCLFYIWTIDLSSKWNFQLLQSFHFISFYLPDKKTSNILLHNTEIGKGKVETEAQGSRP